ncbi:MAG: hypothetical protein EPN47_06605 [Acidobacteria bacterium]|nr:MAG: hypothetical protein EPN47_06605 [Acidobacteriota bacterium]
MNSAHLPVGMVLVGVTIGFLGLRYFSRAKRGELRVWGWAGLAMLLLFEVLLVFRVGWVATYLTPLCWTAYLLLADAAVCSLKGSSRLSDSPRAFFLLALASIPLWLIFEAYNLRMQNWAYVGLPPNPILRNFGYAWSFATIWPAIFETADLLQALGLFNRPIRPHAPFSFTFRLTLAIFGILFLTAPILFPVGIGQYLFALVWVGFVLLLDPLNYAWGGRSLLRDWEKGDASLFWNFMAAGLVCGIFWEFWNYWATARWIYIFPILQGWKIFEMPMPGFLGFPAFAVECFVMFESLKVLVKGLFRARRDEHAFRPFSAATKGE